MPAYRYTLKNGDPVPSVTTIISRFKDSEPLKNWAWKQGMAGRDYRDVLKKAADAGTIVHALVESDIKGIPPPDLSAIDSVTRARIENAHKAYRRWARWTKLKVVETETSLVSEIFGYGGTPDAIVEIEGELSMADWKATNGLWPDYLFQLAAYGHLWNENHPERKVTGGFHLCRFGKEFGDFHHSFWKDLDLAFQGFLLMIKLWRINYDLKKMIGR